MGVVTVSSSVSRSPLSLTTRLRSRHPSVKKAHFLAFKSDNSKSSGFVTTKDSLKIPTESTVKKSQNSLKRTKKKPKKVKAVATEEASPSTSDLDYDTLAATLENIYKLSPDIFSDSEDTNVITTRSSRPRKAKTSDCEKNVKERGIIVRNKKKRARLSLDKRMALKKDMKRVVGGENVDRLLRDYSASTDLASLDWKKMKIPAVLSSSEHTWLFKLMQPMKSILEVKENLHVELDREPSDGEFAAAINMKTSEMRKQIQIGRAARNKLIKHNLRLVLFVINKYYQDLANGPKFQDLCQAGVKGLIMAIDRFEQKRGFRLSTYALFWIRHAIIRSMTVSSFTRVPFGIESVKQEIQKTKLELMFDLGRQPTEEEIIERLGISPNRYRDIVRASKQVLSLHSRHSVTQEEFIKGITDVERVGDDKHRQSALLRLALDDVLDSLKPKENLVIRQRYGLDGKGDRTLGEIAGNLNISREMVRKHEMKALMKLKHPARVDYLRRHIT